MSPYQSDILIIGCGIAGASAALRLAQDRQRQITIITRSTEPEDSNTRYAQGGIVTLGEGDSSDLLVEDILAAGDGDRLGHLIVTCPKVLLPIKNGEPLIQHPIEALVSAEIHQIAVVVGYLGDMVKELLGDGSRYGAELQYIQNFDYFGGNAASLHKAMEWVGKEPLVLCMGDHLIDRDLVKTLVKRKTIDNTLCVDFNPSQSPDLVDEATKVVIDNNGCISDIGKNLVYWDAIDTGVFLLTGKFLQFVDKLVALSGPSLEMDNAIQSFIDQGHNFLTCDVSGHTWMDIDTEQDLILARK